MHNYSPGNRASPLSLPPAEPGTSILAACGSGARLQNRGQGRQAFRFSLAPGAMQESAKAWHKGPFGAGRPAKSLHITYGTGGWNSCFAVELAGRGLRSLR